MSFIVGFDGGFGSTKVVASNGKKFEIPNIVSSGYNMEYKNIFTSSQNNIDMNNDNINENWLHVQVNGEEYFVGNLALNESQMPPSYSFSEDPTKNSNNEIIIATAVGGLMSKEEEDIIIAASLPIASYGKISELYKKYLLDFHVEIYFENKNINKKIRRVVKFKNAKIVPQAIVALKPILINKSNIYCERNDQETHYAIVDIGMKTMDVVVIKTSQHNNQKPEVIHNMSFGSEVGMSLLHKKLATYMSNEFSLNLDLPQLDGILKNKNQWNRYKLHDVIKSAKISLIKSVFAGLEGKWRDPHRKNEISYIYFIGGGSQQIFDEIENVKDIKDSDYYKERIVLAHNPRFANAEGCFSVANMVDRMSKVYVEDV